MRKDYLRQKTKYEGSPEKLPSIRLCGHVPLHLRNYA